MENAQKWMALISGYVPQIICVFVLLCAIHGFYWHVELTKEFWGVVGMAAGFLLGKPAVAR